MLNAPMPISGKNPVAKLRTPDTYSMTMVPISATINAGTPIITQMLRGSRSGRAIGGFGATRTGFGGSMLTRLMGNAFLDI
ncbi:Uncharacterised protein [Mycobacterium tuberculosis]|nr:Uncharacterised protein [Mycobacterium tuberculosis]CKP97170.1 Uncharacterised protein [Mycobacterium tuberculosis]CKR34915.1 Uncharacterised protein [Mycobacterium tuberculosis]CKR78786.1 Uncharacterised protein [Mycobacterium tuberculosis]CKR87145.1 Uncharacterised protein [Mycobacterium tuberculosis]